MAKIIPHKETYHPSLAGKILTYISEFDGTKKEFSAGLDEQFNNIYHEHYCSKSHGSPSNREELKKLHEALFHLGARVSVEQFGFIAANCFLFTVHVIYEGKSFVVHNLIATHQNKIVRSQVLGELENTEIYHRNIH